MNGRRLLKRVVRLQAGVGLLLGIFAVYLLWCLISLQAEEPSAYSQMLVGKSDVAEIRSIANAQVKVLTNDFQAARVLLRLSFAVVLGASVVSLISVSLLRGLQPRGAGVEDGAGSEGAPQ